MCMGRVRETVTSMSENKAALPSVADGLEVIDLPGHVSLRAEVDKFAPRALGVVYMIDSEAFKKSSADIAEYLYNLLAMPTLRKVPFLVLCNKQDLMWTASKPKAIRTKLEAEFHTIRTTKRLV